MIVYIDCTHNGLFIIPATNKVQYIPLCCSSVIACTAHALFITLMGVGPEAGLVTEECVASYTTGDAETSRHKDQF